MRRSKSEHTYADLSKLGDSEWLVTARSGIQFFMLELYNHMGESDGSKTSVDWHLFLGAAFSLWRAVFLVETKDKSRKKRRLNHDARMFLDKIIKTNAIAFTDELKYKLWSSGYYLNNARYRVKTLVGGHGYNQIIEVSSNAALKSHWNKTFVELRRAFAKAVA